MKIEVSIGEVVDKITILDIKLQHIKDSEKLQNIKTEYTYLKSLLEEEMEIDSQYYNELKAVNQDLWNLEDDIRLKEKAKAFDNQFIHLARQIYITNDKRAEIKKDINLKYNSLFVEEKSYEKY